MHFKRPLPVLTSVFSETFERVLNFVSEIFNCKNFIRLLGKEESCWAYNLEVFFFWFFNWSKRRKREDEGDRKINKLEQPIMSWLGRVSFTVLNWNE